MLNVAEQPQPDATRCKTSKTYVRLNVAEQPQPEQLDAKPVDAKPVDAKPVDAKPPDAKPASNEEAKNVPFKVDLVALRHVMWVLGVRASSCSIARGGAKVWCLETCF